MEKLLREILQRPDPQGYYVVPLRYSPSCEEALENLVQDRRILLERLGDTLLLRVKSRSLARRLVETLARRGCRVGEP